MTLRHWWRTRVTGPLDRMFERIDDNLDQLSDGREVDPDELKQAAPADDQVDPKPAPPSLGRTA